MALTDRVKSFFGMEGSQRGPFFGQGEQGSWFELGSREDGFQRNLNVDRFTMDRIPAISGAKHLYRSAFAQLRGDHHDSTQAEQSTQSQPLQPAGFLSLPTHTRPLQSLMLAWSMNG